MRLSAANEFLWDCLGHCAGQFGRGVRMNIDNFCWRRLAAACALLMLPFPEKLEELAHEAGQP